MIIKNAYNNGLMALSLVIFFICSPFSYGLPLRNILLFLLFFLIVFLKINDSKDKELYFYLLFSLSIVLCFLISIYGSNFALAMRYLLYSIALFSACMIFQVTSHSEKFGKGFFEFFIYICLFILVLSAILTINTSLNDPFFIRQVRISDSTTHAFGVGGYEFIYTLVLLSIMLLKEILNNEIVFFRYKFFLLSSLVVFLLAIFLSNFMTAVFLLFIGILFLVRTIYLIYIVLIVFVLVFSVLQFPQIIISILPEGALKYKLESILFVILTDNTALSELWFIFARLDKYYESVLAFTQNFFFGISNRKLLFEDGHLVGFGQHSFFLDTLALFGLFGVYYLSFFIKQFNGCLTNNKVAVEWSVLAPFLVLIIINNISAELVFTTIFFSVILKLNKISMARQ